MSDALRKSQQAAKRERSHLRLVRSEAATQDAAAPTPGVNLSEVFNLLKRIEVAITALSSIAQRIPPASEAASDELVYEPEAYVSTPVKLAGFTEPEWHLTEEDLARDR
jgi:hypothetical protein